MPHLKREKIILIFILNKKPRNLTPKKIMKLPPRLEKAITKLYTAFHHGTLNPEDCHHCAVGNICDNLDTWKHLTEQHGSTRLSYLGRLNEGFGRRVNGYSPSELLTIEALFLRGCGYRLPFRRSEKKVDPRDKEAQFNGLCAVVEYLCALDGVDNVMDVSRLFEYENDLPVHRLELGPEA